MEVKVLRMMNNVHRLNLRYNYENNSNLFEKQFTVVVNVISQYARRTTDYEYIFLLIRFQFSGANSRGSFVNIQERYFFVVSVRTMNKDLKREYEGGLPSKPKKDKKTN